MNGAAQLWFLAAGGFGSLALAFGALSLMDRRSLDDDPLWAKPTKFALSFAVHFVTLALIADHMMVQRPAAAIVSISANASVAAAVLELVYIAVQAARQRRSHFNTATAFEFAMYGFMGLGAVVILSPAVVVGIVCVWQRQLHWPAPVQIGVVVGLLGGAVLTLRTAFRMGSTMSRFGGPPPEHAAPKMIVTGWRMTAGDLRPSHFLATHMIQIVPAFGVVESFVLPGPLAGLPTILFAAGLVLLTLWAFERASAGKPPIPLNLWFSGGA